MAARKVISIISPVYNEEAGIDWFHQILCDDLSKIKSYAKEIIYINDGSRDGSLASLRALKTPHADISTTIVNLSRNFGKEAALSAGLTACTGDAALMIDSDGQHPTNLISEFVKKWEDGDDVIIGIRDANKNEGLVKRFGSKVFYELFNKIAGTTLIAGSTDFRLIDRKVINEFIKLDERNRITRGLIDWLGFQRGYIHFTADARQFGAATYSVKKLFELAVNTFVSLSAVPLFIAGYMGLLFMLLGLATGVFIITEQFILGDPMSLHISGSAMLGVLIVFLVGIILSAQGLVGVYISRLLAEGQRRPLFIIRDKTTLKNS